jgi:hypothetical protein
LFLLFLIWRWISPSTADNLLYWFQNLPVNTEILNKDIILPLHNGLNTVRENVEDELDEAVDTVESLS